MAEILCESGSRGGAWVALSIKRLTLDFGSSHDLVIPDFEPHVGLHIDSAWDSLSLPLSLPLPHLRINKQTNK